MTIGTQRRCRHKKYPLPADKFRQLLRNLIHHIAHRFSHQSQITIARNSIALSSRLPLLAQFPVLLDQRQFFGRENQRRVALSARVSWIAEGNSAGVAAVAVDHTER